MSSIAFGEFMALIKKEPLLKTYLQVAWDVHDSVVAH